MSTNPSAVYVKTHGDASVLEYGPLTHFDVSAPPPEGFARVRIAYSGINFIDTYYRSGLYKRPLPMVCGDEGSGVIEALTLVANSSKECAFAVGERVVFFRGSTGAYATHALVPLVELHRIPEGRLSLANAASLLLQGGTAHYLATGCVNFYQTESEAASTSTSLASSVGYPSVLKLSFGQTPPVGCYHSSEAVCLVHAAAGGTGLLLTQLLKKVLRVRGVVGCCRGVSKCQLALTVGCCDAVVNTEDNSVWTPSSTEEPLPLKHETWPQAVRYAVESTTAPEGASIGPKCIDCVYDGIGASTFHDGLSVLKERGTMVTFGNASGAVPPIPPLLLTQSGSVSLQRPTLKDYTRTAEETAWRMGEVLQWASEGSLNLSEGLVWELCEAAEAQRSLEGRLTTGKVVLRCS